MNNIRKALSEDYYWLSVNIELIISGLVGHPTIIIVGNVKSYNNITKNVKIFNIFIFSLIFKMLKLKYSLYNWSTQMLY